ncbi:MAG: GAF domain-containing protein [Symplocastrum torsivum CPER-KK1]|jgi:twitching motility protein PilJ|uniref:GAF domain-containing protein n=1 Tax=Symplocastrum torsivum CPER-KK1 TaxID=450513 RepID=A0A951PIM5_9CYAN|nr:GAF domain-containing protein [Symplocastrum torsivum CPER-KK1]
MLGLELLKEQSISQPYMPRPKNRRFSPLQWYYKLPIQSKQITRSYTSQFISIFGLVGVGSVIVITAGRTQLVNQAKAELAVTEINYNIKVNQMGFGFRGQSDNPAIVAAATYNTEGKSLTPAIQEQVKQILQNEIKARNIEYATLVGKDKRIIVNANDNRTGETFDPNNLVSQIFKNPEQIKASGLVSWNDLAKESPALPQGFVKQDALIRYTVTPIKEPANGTVIGALVSGDIVNNKLPIVEESLKAFGSGYSGIYLRKPTGEFVLATSLDQKKKNNSTQVQVNHPLHDATLLKQAVADSGQVVTRRVHQPGEQTYTMAAKALLDFKGEPVGILVRGTPEIALNALIQKSLLLQVVIATLALVAEILLVKLLSKTIAQPIKKLQQATQEFANGDRQVRAEALCNDELGQLAQTFNEMAESIVASEKFLAQQSQFQKAQAERSLVLAEFTSRIYKSLNTEAIFSIAVDEIRKVLQTDRVVIYRFYEDRHTGIVSAESVVLGWRSAIGQVIYDPLTKESIDRYKNQRVSVCNNIYEVGFSQCHCEILESLEVKANMVAPILQGGELVALLCAHQCSAPRNWTYEETALLKQLAAQIGLALNHASLLEQLERSRQEAELARQEAESVSKQVEQARQLAELNSLEQRQQKEALEHQVLALLDDIEATAQGDLTVRADVSESQLGTVADFFNLLIENLREIVVQVKQASAQVNTSLEEDQQAVEQLSLAAFKQSSEVTHILNSVEQMMYSVQVVAENAHKAAAVAHTAATAAETSGAAIDSTVNKIVNLQTTVVKTADKVRLLSDSSQQIAKVVSLVQQIALQTNLLAVNAGIEANRAGEEGEGFRVVAAQVGALATQSTNAIKEIEQVIETIQLGTKEVVEAMEEGRTQVVDSTNQVVDAKQSLEQIFEVSREIDELVQSISDATVAQTQISEGVTDLIQEIAETSKLTSDSSRKVSSSLRQTVEVAEKLQMSVGRFKVGSEEHS